LVQETKGKTRGISKVPRIVACIPAYNEERCIGPVVLKTLEFVDRVIVCDDGSGDLTGQIAAMMGATVITHESNRGMGLLFGAFWRRLSGWGLISLLRWMVMVSMIRRIFLS